MRNRFWLPLMLLLAGITTTAVAQPLRVTDMVGRRVTVPDRPARIVCIGPGALRLIVYLETQGRVVGVESMEKRNATGRPYWLAHPQLRMLPVIGPGGPAAINKKPDMEAVLRAAPDLIFATYLDADVADTVAGTLGIPVVVLSYGELAVFDTTVYDALRLAGIILGKKKRADAVIEFIDGARTDLHRRTIEIPDEERPGVFVGGIGYRGAHGIESTQRDYIPLD
jgi:iron complex transport system substrate-binding protein